MGNVSSLLEDEPVLHLADQNRFAIKSLTITNSRHKTLLTFTPNAFPASRIIARRDIGDDTPVEYIQDPDSASPTSPPSFLIRLSNEDELTFKFSIILRQTQANNTDGSNSAADTVLNGLTFAFAPTKRELDTLVTREFHADVNLHKNSNVELVRSQVSTEGSPSAQLEWSWKWRPPKPIEDKGGGWRNTCTFAEYNQRAHRLQPLATFSFWVHNAQRGMMSPQLPSPQLDKLGLAIPRLRVPSSQSVNSGMSDSEGPNDSRDLPSPIDGPDLLAETMTATTLAEKEAPKIDILCQRPGEDLSAVDDGPLFRATMKALEQKTGNMRQRMKKVLRKAEAAQIAQVDCNDAVTAFMEALREASISNASAIQPALEHYFEKIAKQVLMYEKQNTINLHKQIIEPLSKLYHIDIKQAEAKKKIFEDESKDYYAYVSRYLGQRQDSLKEKKRIESDSKYQTKRRNFELKRFDYSSFMQDLHGGRKEQEVLSQLTKYADAQAKGFMATAKKVEEMIPRLEALIKEVSEADKEFQLQRTEREEKRRILEKSTSQFAEPENSSTTNNQHTNGVNGSGQENDMARADSTGRGNLHHTISAPSQHGATYGSSAPSGGLAPSLSVRSVQTPTASPHDKFKGFRDLEDRNQNGSGASAAQAAKQRKEGLLWALSRPNSHADPRGLNKQAWHKFWIVLDQGKLSEYSNWKERLDLHAEPIDLRIASVREARNAERRFCFEVITPSYKRVYQATSEDDMSNWINAINNALQSAFEGRNQQQAISPSPTPEDKGLRRDIGSILTGKTSSYTNYQQNSPPSTSSNTNNSNVYRRTTVGARPSYVRSDSKSFEENPAKLLQTVRDNDQGNYWCADCGSGVKTEWVSINLGIILCIECSGIHRSLGTHISKIRSLTLDTTSFTTDIVELLLQIGNRVSNFVWEAKLDPSLKIGATATRDQRLKFITDKYSNRLFVNPISSTLSHFSTADETLLASIKKNDIQGVLYGLALRGNPNAADRSRNTHAVYLALAAADPASPHAQLPGTTTTTSSTTSSISSKNNNNNKVISFPIAELLVQNGGIIPDAPPAFPLSPAAQLYVDQKRARTASGGAQQGANLTDTLSALPNIGKGGAVAGERERERLQKRVSAGARMVGRSIGV
ncbi:hypothetical protein MMC25_001554 [Agyrium rufum]|nr:hypothetical protein [Agyrium rufum]